MPKYYEHTTTFHFTWEQVAQAFWKRYPNPNSAHVLTEDTIQREVRSGILFSKRLLSKTNSSVPKWAERFVPGSKVVCIIEESIVDPKRKELVTYTRNVGYTKIMSITEKVIYREDTPGTTVAIRSAWIDSQVKGFGRAICAFGMDRFRKNCSKMVGGFNYVLTSLYPNSGTTASSFHATTYTATSKLKDAAKNASELAKAKAVPIYATLHPNQS